MTTSSSRSMLAGVVLVALAFAVRPASAVQYTVTDLGNLGNAYSVPTSINTSGQVVGYTGSGPTAFLYSSGIMTDLGTLGGPSYANGINDSGQIVGDAFTGVSQTTARHAFFYDGTMHDLGTLGGTDSIAFGINASGQIVGEADTGNIAYGDPVTHAFLYSNGTMHDLGSLGTGSYAEGINASGQIVGSTNTLGATYHAFLYNNGTMHDLGTLGGTYSYGYAINASGQVVGSSWTGGIGNPYHAFLDNNGTMHDLGTLGGTYSTAYGINDNGQIVGEADTSGDVSDAFLYDGTMHDLNDLLVPGSGWMIADAFAINDNGWIAAYGSSPAEPGNSEALLLTPVPTPEPASLTILSLGVVGLLARRQSHR